MVRNERVGDETFHLSSWHHEFMTFDNRVAFHCKYKYCIIIIIIVVIT